MSGKFTIRIDLKDEEDGGDVAVFASGDHLLLITKNGEDHEILDDRTILCTLASQDADNVAVTGGSIIGITAIAVADGGTGASTPSDALVNLGAVPITRTVNGKTLESDIVLGPDAVGALPNTTAYDASLAADGRDISLLDKDGDTLATVQTQDISGKLDKQAIYTSSGATNTFFHEEDGRGYKLTDTNDNSLSFLGGNADPASPIKVESYAKTVSDNVGTRLIQTLDKIYYTAGNDDSSYVTGDDIAVISNIPRALSQLTNDGNYVIDDSYVHTDNNYPDSEKSKLAGLDDNHFKGSSPTLEALETAYPTANDGDYAYVGVAGAPAVIFIWDVTDSQWVQGGSPAGETPASVKEKYQSNPDANTFRDSGVALIATIGDVADLTTSAKGNLVAAVNEVVSIFDSIVPTTRTVNGNALSSDIVLTNTDIGSEPAITARTTAQFWRGDKAWTDFGTFAKDVILTGLSTGTDTAMTATDTILSALGKLQAQLNDSNPMTTARDIIIGGTNGSPTCVPLGSVSQVITSNGISPI
jgi:hypothetical protein